MFETEFVSVDPDEAPDGEDEDPEHIETKHLHDTIRKHTMVAAGSRDGDVVLCGTYCFCGDLEPLLHEPEQAGSGVSSKVRVLRPAGERRGAHYMPRPCVTMPTMRSNVS